MLGCSKGARGLSVHVRVTGVFTGTTNSPSSWLRQCPDRYTIRAGRNLPDKEFRYLRTVQCVTILSLKNRTGYFYLSLYVAIQFGLYHH
jgi:hypothetical protein